MRQSIAFFDLDGTITKKDTYIDFILFVRGKSYFFYGLLKTSLFIIAYLIRLYPNYRLKEKFFQTYLKKYSPENLIQLGNEYSINRLPELLYNDALERILWHKSNGHRVIILTASSPIWLAGWCKSNDLEIIGTEFQINDGRYTGRIKGKNCYGEEKFKIVNKILSDNTEIETYGYGDSKSDLFFLKSLKNYKFRYFKK